MPLGFNPMDLGSVCESNAYGSVTLVPEAASRKQQATSDKLLTKQDSGIIKDVERKKIMKPYRATLRLLFDYDKVLVDVIQFLDSHKHSNEPVRAKVDKLLNHSDQLKKAVELELKSHETGVRTTEL